MYRLADVAWVTPVRDGMNLVAKEYVAARQDDPGVLVLSEFAGAASEMGEALQHNPWDIEGTARVLERALSIEPAEMTQRMATLRRRVHANTVHRWVSRFLSALKSQHVRHMELRREDGEAFGSAGWVVQMVDQFTRADSALVALDYDGTLVALQPTPEQTAPDPQLATLLRELAELEGVEVVVISGRDPDTLGRWLGDLPVSLVAEHGLHWRIHGGSWDVLLHNADTSWKGAVREILEDYSSRSPGSFIEEKPASLAWHSVSRSRRTTT